MPGMNASTFPVKTWVFWHVNGTTPLVGQIAGILPPGTPISSKTIREAGIDPATVDRLYQDPGLDVVRPDEPRYLVLLTNPAPGGRPFLVVPDPLRLSALPGLSQATPTHGTTIDEVLRPPVDGKTIEITSNGSPVGTKIFVSGKELQRVRSASISITPTETVIRIEGYSPRMELIGILANITEFDPTAEVEDNGTIEIDHQSDNG